MAKKENKGVFKILSLEDDPIAGLTLPLTLSGVASGLTMPQISVAVNSREVPSQSDWAEYESDDIRRGSFDIVVDVKGTTAGLYQFSGRFFTFEEGPWGAETGDLKMTGRAYCENVQPSADGTSLRVTLPCRVSGEITYDAYS